MITRESIERRRIEQQRRLCDLAERHVTGGSVKIIRDDSGVTLTMPRDFVRGFGRKLYGRETESIPATNIIVALGKYLPHAQYAVDVTGLERGTVTLRATPLPPEPRPGEIYMSWLD